MHKILRPEQLQSMAREIETSFDAMSPTYTHKVLTIEQFYTLHNEVFLVEMELDPNLSSSVLVHKNTTLSRWEPVSSCTFRAPEFTHGSQNKR